MEDFQAGVAELIILGEGAIKCTNKFDVLVSNSVNNYLNGNLPLEDILNIFQNVDYSTCAEVSNIVIDTLWFYGTQVSFIVHGLVQRFNHFLKKDQKVF